MKSDGARKQVSDVWSHCSLVIPPTSPGLLLPQSGFYHQTHPYPWHPKLCLTFSPCPGKVIPLLPAPVRPPAGTESITDAHACSTASHRGPTWGPAPSWQGHGVFSGQPHWSSCLIPPIQALSVSWHRGYNPMGHHPLGIWAEGFPHLNWGLECDLAANGTVDLAARSHEPAQVTLCWWVPHWITNQNNTRTEWKRKAA